MGHVARQSYTVPDGQGGRTTRYSRKWYCFFRDSNGKERRVPGYSDKRATEQLLAQLERDAARVAVGLLPPAAETDLLRRPLLDHLADFLATKDGAVCPGWRRRLEAHLRRTLEATGWGRLADVTVAGLERFLASLRRGGCANGTSNNYLRCARGFISWVARRAGTANPLTGMAALNPEAGRKRLRRALTEDEFGRLIAATEDSPRVSYRLDGPARAVLYLTAGYTGLRASELASLTAAHLDLQAGLVSLDARDEKARRGAVLPLHPQLVCQLQLWLRRNNSGNYSGAIIPAPLWPGCWARGGHGAEVLRRDLAAAGIPFRDGRGRVVDFHALRVTYITSLARAGVALTVAQRLARHSTPVLTANVYSQLEQEDLARGVAALPPLPEPRRKGA